MPVPIPAWQVIYGGRDITRNLVKHAGHIYYTESIGGKASTLEVAVEDASKVFQDHPPTPGIGVALAIGYQGAPLTSCGLFEVDEWEFRGPPDLFTLRAIQAGITRAMRTPKSIGYENQSLVQIASGIAARYGMTVVADVVQPNVIYQRVTQRMESDLGFLHRIANQHDYDFNVRGNQLVFFSRPQLEGAPSVGLLQKTAAMTFALKNQHLGKRAYKTAAVTYLDPYSKKLVQAQISDPNATSTDTLHIASRIENNQQGTLRAQAHLHTANMHQIKGQITIPGTMLYRAGNRITLGGFGAFDSVAFIVQAAKHHLSTGQGYRTTLEVRTTVSQGTGGQLVSQEFGEGDTVG